MAGERNQDRERARARAAERLVVPASWARILDLARERWPGLDTRGVTSWPELGERLAEDDVLPKARVEAEVAQFRNSLPPKPERQRPLSLSQLWREGQKRTVYQSEEGREVGAPFWRGRQPLWHPAKIEQRRRWARQLRDLQPFHPAQPSPWRQGLRAYQAQQNSALRRRRLARGLPGDVGTDDEWGDEGEGS